MPAIFVCYRHEDSVGHAGRLFDQLKNYFGHENVFWDKSESIELGEPFDKAIERAVGSCNALLAIIGKDWVTCTDAKGKRRIEDPHDFVRLELAMALRRNILVIPVLVNQATMPGAEDLPEELQPLAKHQAIELSDRRWDFDVRQLIESLKRKLRRRKWLQAAGSVTIFLVVVGLGLWGVLKALPPDPPPWPSPCARSQAKASDERLYLYKDYQDPANYQPLVPLSIPASAAENNHISYSTNADVPGSQGYGNDTSAMAEFLFRKQVIDPEQNRFFDVTIPENFMGLVLATNDSFGMSRGPYLNLKRATSLRLCIRSDSNDPSVMIQVKAFIAHGGGFDDSSHPVSTQPFSARGTWMPIDIPLGGLNLSHIITPLVVIVHKPSDRDRVVVYLDEVYYELDHKNLPFGSLSP